MPVVNFVVEESLFEKTVFFIDEDKKIEVCRISQYSNDLEVYTKKTYNHLGTAVCLEVDFLLNRDTSLTSYSHDGDVDTLVFKEFKGLTKLEVGKTPPKIKRLFHGEKKSYLEVFAKCKNKNRTIYFSVRHLIEEELDENEKPQKIEYFLIGAYLYDPKSINDEVYLPLQSIYSRRIKRSELE